jgi:transcriptional regulator with XRE-family HTH domain
MNKKAKTDFELYVIGKVRDKRMALKLSQDDLAMFLDADRSFIGQIESPNNPAKYHLNHLNILARELNCSPKDFLPDNPIPNAESDTIVPIVEKWVEKGAIMVTDQLNSYKPLSENYFHISVDHSAGEYATGAFSSNGIENFWSLFKRGIIGIYHQVSPKQLQRYSTEFSYRYNTRDQAAAERFKNTIKNANSARLKFKDLIKG